MRPLIALLVEDDPADAELMALRLESPARTGGGRRVQLIRSESVESAISVLRGIAVDVIILDLTLPDAHGLEALHRVRAASASTPVIVCTGVTDQTVALDALRAGAQDYVLKPPPAGGAMSRIIHYAWERQQLHQALDASLRASAVAERQWRLLAEISQLIGETHDLRPALERIAHVIVPYAADCLVLYRCGKSGNPSRPGRWCVAGERAGEIRDTVHDLLQKRDGDVLSRLAGRDALLPLLASHGLASGTAAPLRHGGRVRGLLILATDTTRRDALIDDAFTRAVADRIDMALASSGMLRRTQRAVAARDRAVGIVSHDLRNPLNTILICANALLDDEPAPPHGVRHMGRLIQRSATWMRQIVDDLLDRAALDAGRLTLHREATAPSDLLSAAQLMFVALAEEGEVELVVRESGHLPPMDADPHRLLQALSNLVGNAVKFTPHGGRVELRAELEHSVRANGARSNAEARAVRISVSDTGPGIPSDDLAHVFDWFWHSPRESRRGIGLGLAIAKGIVAAHRGTLSVESVTGRGSTFSFTIPIVAARRGARRLRAAVS